MSTVNKFILRFLYLCTYVSLINSWISTFPLLGKKSIIHRNHRGGEVLHMMAFKPTTYSPFPLADKKLNK